MSTYMFAINGIFTMKFVQTWGKTNKSNCFIHDFRTFFVYKNVFTYMRGTLLFLFFQIVK